MVPPLLLVRVAVFDIAAVMVPLLATAPALMAKVVPVKVPLFVSVPAPILVMVPAAVFVPDNVVANPLVSIVAAPEVEILLERETAAADCKVVPAAMLSAPVPRAELLPTASVPSLSVVPPT